MRKVMLGACLLFVCLCVAKTAVACTCVGESPNAFAELQGRDAVFVGKVMEVKEVQIPYKTEAGLFTVELEIKFRIKKYLKGPSGSTVSVRTNTGCCGCGSEFDRGKKYLVYADFYRNMLRTSYCTRTKPLKYAQKDLQEIEKGRREQKIMKKRQPFSPDRSITSPCSGPESACLSSTTCV